jgi:hypothetical protein
MIEVKVIIAAPELSEAINNLAAAISNRPITTNNTTPVEAKATPNAPAAFVSTTPVQQATVPDNSVIATAPMTNPTTAVPKTAPTVEISSVNTASPSEQPVKTYTKEELSNAGAALCEQGKMADLIDLLAKYGVQSIVELDKEHYAAIAVDLKALGANL